MKQSSSCEYHSVTPSLIFQDTVKAIEFYKKAFGAKELTLLHWPNSKGVMHATVQIGNSTLMMADEMPGQACKSSETLGSSPVSFYVYVENVDSFFKKALEAGAVTAMPVADMFWGDRMGQLKDPFGYSWGIATKMKTLSEEEIQKGSEVFCAQMAGKKS